MTLQSDIQTAKSLWVKIPTVLVLIAVGCAVVLGAYWIGKRTADHAAYVKGLEAQLDTFKKQASGMAKQDQALVDDRKKINQSTSEDAALVRHERATIRTPEQALEDVNTNLGTHIVFDTGRVQGIDIPNAPSIWKIPNGDISRITGAITGYKVQGVELSGCKQELKKCDEQIAKKDERLTNANAQIANLEKQVKANKPSRFRNCLNSMGSNAVTGVVFAQNKRDGAIGGAVVGLTSCLIFK